MDEERYVAEAEIYGNKIELNEDDDNSAVNYRLMTED